MTENFSERGGKRDMKKKTRRVCVLALFTAFNLFMVLLYFFGEIRYAAAASADYVTPSQYEYDGRFSVSSVPAGSLIYDEDGGTYVYRLESLGSGLAKFYRVAKEPVSVSRSDAEMADIGLDSGLFVREPSGVKEGQIVKLGEKK